jgi:hypothetical protein
VRLLILFTRNFLKLLVFEFYVVMVSVPKLYGVGDGWIIWMQDGMMVDSEKHKYLEKNLSTATFFPPLT